MLAEFAIQGVWVEASVSRRCGRVSCGSWSLDLAALAAPLLTARQMGWGSWAPGVQGDQKQAPTEVLFLATWLVVSLFCVYILR